MFHIYRAVEAARVPRTEEAGRLGARFLCLDDQPAARRDR